MKNLSKTNCHFKRVWILQMKNGGTHNCLDTMGRKSGEDVGLSYCHGLGGNQVRNLSFTWYLFYHLLAHDPIKHKALK